MTLQTPTTIEPRNRAALVPPPPAQRPNGIPTRPILVGPKYAESGAGARSDHARSDHTPAERPKTADRTARSERVTYPIGWTAAAAWIALFLAAVALAAVVLWAMFGGFRMGAGAAPGLAQSVQLQILDGGFDSGVTDAGGE